MNKNMEFLRQTRVFKTVAGIVSIVSSPIVFIQLIFIFAFHGRFGRMFMDMVLAGMLLSGGITMLVGRSKMTGGVAPIVLFAIGLGFGLLGYGRLWYWIIWTALCLAAAIYFRVSMKRVMRGEQVQFTPSEAAGQVAGAVRDWAPQAANAVRTAAGAAVNIAQDAADSFREHQAQQQYQNQQYQNQQYQNQQYQQNAYDYQQTQQNAYGYQQTPQQPQQPQQAPWAAKAEPYVPQAAQAAERGYTSPFTVQPTKSMSELEQEILAQKAAQAAPAAPAVPDAPAAEAAPAVPTAEEQAAVQAAQDAAAEAAQAAAEMQQQGPFSFDQE